MGEEERAVEVEVDQLLPVGEAQLLDRGPRVGDHRAAADRVDQDVDRRRARAPRRRPARRPPPARARRPAGPRRGRRASASAIASSSRPWWLSTPITVAPSRTMISAVARPMPLAAAVISATLFLKRMAASVYSAAWATLAGPHFFTTGSTSLANSFRPRSADLVGRAAEAEGDVHLEVAEQLRAAPRARAGSCPACPSSPPA